MDYTVSGLCLDIDTSNGCCLFLRMQAPRSVKARSYSNTTFNFFASSKLRALRLSKKLANNCSYCASLPRPGPITTDLAIPSAF